jgi:Stress responsive A/B Barrel Domain
MIAHIVLFNRKPEIGADKLLSCAQLLERLMGEVGGIQRASVGRRVEIDAGYVRPFGEKTYKYLCILEFNDKQSLVNYLNHDLHRELGRLFWEISESALVVECEMVDATTGSVTRLLV